MPSVTVTPSSFGPIRFAAQTRLSRQSNDGSSWCSEADSSAGAALAAVSELRFFGMEHMLGMIIGIIVAQVGSIKAKKQSSDAGKFRTAFFWFLAATIIILLMIPFGIWNAERPLFRM